MTTLTFQPPELYNSRGGQVRAIVIVFPVLAFLAIALRYYTRITIVKNFGPDDICAGTALILSIATSICMCYEVKYGLGRHVQTLTPLDYTNSQKALFASILVYNPGLVFIKLSILLQYLRICVPRGTRLVCRCLMLIVILYGGETFFTGLFTCIPVAFFWDPSISGGRCVNKLALYYANAAINIAQDFAILIFPIFMLHRLQVPRRQKITLMLVLALGGFACIASIFCLRTLHTLSISSDPSWDSTGIATWSALELNIGIICACLTTLRPLLNRCFPDVFPARNLGGYMAHTAGTRVESQSQRELRVRTPQNLGKGEVIEDRVSFEENNGWRETEMGRDNNLGVTKVRFVPERRMWRPPIVPPKDNNDGVITEPEAVWLPDN